MDLSMLSTALTLIGTLLIHSVWQGVAVGLLYALTMLALGGASPQARYGAALFWLVALAFAPFATALWLLSGTTSSSTILFLGAALGGQYSAGIDLALLAPVLTSLWLAGVLVLGIRLLWNWRRTERLTYLGCHPMPAVWNERLAALARQMGVRIRVKIAESVLVPVPTVIGWLKPVILIPSSALLGLTQRQLELIIAHELAHIRRYDYVVNYFLLAMETLFFYHPMVYIIGRGLRNERELCCDDLVVARCGGRIEYVTALTDLETLRSGDVLTGPLSSLAATGGDLLHRVHRIVRGQAPSTKRGYIVTATAALTLLVGAVAIFARYAEDAMPVAVHSAVSYPATAASKPAERPPVVATPSAWATYLTDIEAPVRTGSDDRQNADRRDEEETGTEADHARAIAEAQTVTPVATLALAVVVPGVGAHEPPAAAKNVTARPVALALTHSFEIDAATLPAPEPSHIGVPVSAGIAKTPKPLSVPSALAEVPSQPVRVSAGPTRAMKSELHLSLGILDTVSDLQRDASRALAVSESPYVIVGSQNLESDYVVSDVTDYVHEEGGALIKRIEPRYPSRARIRGYTDTVQIEFRVTDMGYVRNIVVVSSSRMSFERAVVRAVRKWRYEPLIRDGIPVERTLVETFAFRLSAPANAPPGVGCWRHKTDNTFSCSSPGLSRVL